ncbi:MAG: tyrosine-type recombinase/integrase [Ancalomicrobiaceae bacterium]|nr:tyrosine-type recombinase/integrase [Ancalomicrobiaceae bacterium]
MPRKSKGARLWLRPERFDRDGRRISNALWIIVDGGRQYPTGCAEGEIGRAELALQRHITAKHEPQRIERALHETRIADVLSIYIDDCRPSGDATALKRFKGRINRLNEFFGSKMLAEVNGQLCRSYVAERGSPGGARRDLEDLRAAINHHQSEGLHRGVVAVPLPEKGPSRTRWLTRDEAAALLWACWRTKEVQTIHRGGRLGEPTVTRKYPLRHIARFILLGLYTGTRAGAIASASASRGQGRSWVDLERGIFYRLAEGKAETKKKQPPAPIPPRLLAHMRRWARLDATAADGREDSPYFVEWAGKPVASVKTGFGRAATLAKLGKHVTPHTLRHTAVTWLMQLGVSIWDAAGFVGMSPEMVEKNYGHHHPDYLAAPAKVIGYRHAAGEKLVVSLETARKSGKTKS